MAIDIFRLSEDLQVKHVERDEFVILSGRHRIKASRSALLRLQDQFHREESFEELRNGFSSNNRSEPDIHTD